LLQATFFLLCILHYLSFTFFFFPLPFLVEVSPRYLFFKAFWKEISTSSLSEFVTTVLNVAASSFGSAIKEQFRLIFQLSPVNAGTPYKKGAWRSAGRKNSV